MHDATPPSATEAIGHNQNDPATSKFDSENETSKLQHGTESGSQENLGGQGLTRDDGVNKAQGEELEESDGTQKREQKGNGMKKDAETQTCELTNESPDFPRRRPPGMGMPPPPRGAPPGFRMANFPRAMPSPVVVDLDVEANLRLKFPDWFLNHRAWTREELRSLDYRLSVVRSDGDSTVEVAAGDGYRIEEKLYSLLQQSISGATADDALQSDYSNAIFVLQTPAQGGIRFLDTVVNMLARDLHADLMSLDIDTLADLAMAFGRGMESKWWQPDSVTVHTPASHLWAERPTEAVNRRAAASAFSRLLLAHQIKRGEISPEPETDDEESDGEVPPPPASDTKNSGVDEKLEEKGSDSRTAQFQTDEVGGAADSVLNAGLGESREASFVASGSAQQDDQLEVLALDIDDSDATSAQVKLAEHVDLGSNTSGAVSDKQVQKSKPNTQNNSYETKSVANVPNEEEANPDDDSTENSSDEKQQKPMIIHLRDIREIMDGDLVEDGRKILKFFRNAIREKNKDGRKIVLIGTAVKRNPELDLEWELEDALITDEREDHRQVETRMQELREEENDLVQKMYRKFGVGPGSVIDVAPRDDAATRELVEQERDADNAERNVLAVKRAVRLLLKPDIRHDFLDPATIWDLSSHGEALKLLRSRRWSEGLIQGVARQLLGCLTMSGELSVNDFATAIMRAEALAKATKPWERSIDMDLFKGMKKYEKKLKHCTFYEKQLFSCIVDPDSIEVSFGDIRLHPDTLHAVQDSILMPIRRPFMRTYGVLSKTNARGSLFYGPPGTGKTHLAQAIARECGAPMINVASDKLSSKWVGESEKIIHALFTLAEKLSPCIVFLDEADALFGIRDSSDRGYERQFLNQFLREWGGMGATNRGPHIIASTNRPRDIDAAVLRRLPNKVHIGLPNAEEREDIFKIWLREEKVEGIILSDLAATTEGFSGSDIKNLCEQAALAWERSDWSREDPEARRVLKHRHFTKAKRRVRPSVDPGTLREIDECAMRWNPGTFRPVVSQVSQVLSRGVLRNVQGPDDVFGVD